MSVSIQCDDCRQNMDINDETICRPCAEAKDTEISDLQEELKDTKAERDDFASQLEDCGKKKEE